MSRLTTTTATVHHHRPLAKAWRTAACATALCATLAGAPAQADTAVPLATWGGTNHVNVRDFVPSLERALKAREPHGLKFQHFPSGQLGQDKDMPMAIPMGQVKFAWITVNGWTGVVPDTKVVDAPTGMTMAQFDALLEQPDGLFSMLQKRFREKNSVLLAVTDLGPPAIVSRTPIRSPADLKGKKVRVFSEGQSEAISKLGGAPVSVAFAEVYPAMQHGTIDAAIVGYQGVDSQKLHEVGKHVLLPASFLGTTLMGWAANPQWLDGMPPKDRDVFLQAVREAELENRKAVLADLDALTELYRQRGMDITFLTPDMPEYAQWQDATRPLLDQALKNLSPDMARLIAPKP